MPGTIKPRPVLLDMLDVEAQLMRDGLQITGSYVAEHPHVVTFEEVCWPNRSADDISVPYIKLGLRPMPNTEWADPAAKSRFRFVVPLPQPWQQNLTKLEIRFIDSRNGSPYTDLPLKVANAQQPRA